MRVEQCVSKTKPSSRESLIGRHMSRVNAFVDHEQNPRRYAGLALEHCVRPLWLLWELRNMRSHEESSGESPVLKRLEQRLASVLEGQNRRLVSTVIKAERSVIYTLIGELLGDTVVWRRGECINAAIEVGEDVAVRMLSGSVMDRSATVSDVRWYWENELGGALAAANDPLVSAAKCVMESK